MILFVHMLFGAALGAKIHNPYFAILFSLLGHYFLDLFPHVEYSIHNIRTKDWQKAFFDMIKVVIDFLSAIVIILILSNNHPIIYFCAFVALIPDALTVISDAFPNKVLAWHDLWHTQKIHYLTKQKKFPIVWRIGTQVFFVIISILMLKS